MNNMTVPVGILSADQRVKLDRGERAGRRQCREPVPPVGDKGAQQFLQDAHQHGRHENPEGGDDETPLQVKLNGVATMIAKIGLTTNHMTVVKACICGKVKELDGAWETKTSFSELPDSIMTTLGSSFAESSRPSEALLDQQRSREVHVAESCGTDAKTKPLGKKQFSGWCGPFKFG
jgi:hypothetical protein